jgi:glycosyltransferase involved in cell wall biosynthesis
LYICAQTLSVQAFRNKGWQKARGEIVAFTDDDAYVAEGWLAAYADTFEKEDTHVGMVGGRVEAVFQIPRPPWLPNEKDYLLPSFNAGGELKPFPSGSLPMSVNFALRREVLVETGVLILVLIKKALRTHI